MFCLQINDNYRFLQNSDVTLLRKIAKFVFWNEGLKNKIIFELNIINHQTSQMLNTKYRNKNFPTDVLAFALWDQKQVKTILLGEIYLNYEQTIIQAQKYQHSLKRELGFLFVHGLYHLLGYDHQTKTQENIMFSKQSRILTLVGLKRI